MPRQWFIFNDDFVECVDRRLTAAIAIVTEQKRYVLDGLFRDATCDWVALDMLRLEFDQNWEEVP